MYRGKNQEKTATKFITLILQEKLFLHLIWALVTGLTRCGISLPGSAPSRGQPTHGGSQLWQNFRAEGFCSFLLFQDYSDLLPCQSVRVLTPHMHCPSMRTWSQNISSLARSHLTSLGRRAESRGLRGREA